MKIIFVPQNESPSITKHDHHVNRAHSNNSHYGILARGMPVQLINSFTPPMKGESDDNLHPRPHILSLTYHGVSEPSSPEFQSKCLDKNSVSNVQLIFSMGTLSSSNNRDDDSNQIKFSILPSSKSPFFYSRTSFCEYQWDSHPSMIPTPFPPSSESGN